MKPFKLTARPGDARQLEHFLENTLLTLQPDIDRLIAQPFDEAALKIDKVIYYLKGFDFKDRKSAFVNCLLYNLKKLNIYMGQIHHDSRAHPLSDHAFIRVLEIAHGLDIDDLKERALQDIEEKNLRVRRRNGRIVTVLPEREGAI